MEVKLHIPDPILRSFFMGRYPKHEEGYLVDMNSITGSVICSLISIGYRQDIPPRMKSISDFDSGTKIEPSPEDRLRFESDWKHKVESETVKVYLSRSKINDRFRNKPLYFSKDAECKINSVLRNEFDTTFTSFCSKHEVCGFKVKETIEMFIAEYDLDIFEGEIETLKKRFYRWELKELEKLREKLCKKAYYMRFKAKKKMESLALV